jgi:hypothetical protein
MKPCRKISTRQDLGSARIDVLERLPEFRLLQRYFLERQPSLVTDDRPRSALTSTAHANIYEKFYWRPTELDVFQEPRTRKKSLPQLNLVHAATHHLLVSAFDPRLQGRPRFTLLCEAMASMMDFYWVLASVAAHGRIAKGMTEGLVGQFRKDALANFGKQRGSVEVLLGLINEGATSPYGAYVAGVREMFGVYEALFAAAQARKRGERTDIGELHGRLSAGKFAPVIFTFDLSNNVLFTLAYCDETSDATDHADVAEAFSLLESSASLTDFLSALVGKARRPAAARAA